MRFATRTFLWSFLPFALLLGGSFWYIHRLVETTVREGLTKSLRQAAVSIAQVRKNSELQDNRFLHIVGENPSLKAGLQLLLSDPKSGAARLTVEDQLREICDELHFDYLLISNPDGRTLAGVLRLDNALVAMDIERMKPPGRGFFDFGEKTFQVTSIPINQGEENLGQLSVGEIFSLSEFSTPTVLTRYGKVMKSSVPGVSARDVEAALTVCGKSADCEIRLNGDTYLTLPSDSVNYGEGYSLRTLQNLDSASGPVEAGLQHVFVITGIGAILLALVVTVFSARSIVRPIAGVVETLRLSEHTGLLPEFQPSHATIHEIRELTDTFNRAGFAIRDARDRLQGAYVEFVGSLAGALDARDPYTAGHSRRVSEYACLIASTLNTDAEGLEEIRVGALLHDFGKVGIADSILRKPGRLSTDEFAMLKQHPVIGRRILEGVAGFHKYLPVVELHHENWDGTGYPSGLRGEQVPLFARIVHVADAYDAMTSDRPYRRGLTHEQAIAELVKFAGMQFDPSLVALFIKLDAPVHVHRSGDDELPVGMHIV